MLTSVVGRLIALFFSSCLRRWCRSLDSHSLAQEMAKKQSVPLARLYEMLRRMLCTMCLCLEPPASFHLSPFPTLFRCFGFVPPPVFIVDILVQAL